jgi:hypothetical protein
MAPTAVPAAGIAEEAEKAAIMRSEQVARRQTSTVEPVHGLRAARRGGGCVICPRHQVRFSYFVFFFDRFMFFLLRVYPDFLSPAAA